MKITMILEQNEFLGAGFGQKFNKRPAGHHFACQQF
jgi:hypothetical protein